MPHRSIRRTLIASLAWLAASAAPALADVLVLSNGDHLTGHLVSHQNGKFVFHSEVLGDLVVADTVATVQPSPPSPTPTQSMVGLPPKSATPAAAPKVAVVPSQGGAPVEAVVVKPPVTPWTGKLELGYDNDLTNVRTVSTSVLGEVDRTIGPNELMLKGHYLYGRTDGLATTDQQGVEFRLRHNLNSRLFEQSDTTEGWDRIQLINFDGEENVGLGYKLVSSARQTVDVGSGVTGQYLDADYVQRGYDYLGNMFQDFTYKINGRYTFSEDASAQYSPELRAAYGLDSGVPTGDQIGVERNYDYKLDAALEGKISQHLSLNLHWLYDYDNVVADPNERSEERITTTLGYGF